MNRGLIVVCGPTATGKTAQAIQIAKELDGEVISADSRQIYRGMDIGTAKVTVDEMQGIPHHMLDIIDPNEDFSVAQYKEIVQEKIKEISERGNMPILCGGTGMYIDAVVYDREFPKVPPNQKLRKELEKLSTEKLFAQIVNLDPDRAKELDQHNRPRIIRAIEIAKELGKVPARNTEKTKYDIEWHYLDLPDDKLRKRIHLRNVERLESGLIEEVNNLHENGVAWDRLNSFGLEYRYVSQYLQGEIKNKEDLVEILDQKTWQYAKRQRTWFKKYI